MRRPRLAGLGATVLLVVVAAPLAAAERRPSSVAPMAPALALGPSERLTIPAGQLPPPGDCRVWFPGRAAAAQPPSGQCPVLDRDVPPGAWLLERPSLQRDYVRIRVYDFEKPAHLLSTRLYEASTGRLVGEEPASR